MNNIFYDLTIVLSVIGLFALISVMLGALVWDIYASRRKKRELALLQQHEKSWSGDPRDELLTWYKLRNRVMGDQDITHRQRQQSINIINRHIRICRLRNKSWRSVDQVGGKTIIISTEN